MGNESEAQPQADVLPKEGDLLAGKYRIERILGQGGMGVVVAAHHETLRQRVAVKFLLPEAAKRADSKERFLREARAAVAIQSEHVARVMDVGTLENGSPYMVMELLSGSDLGDVLRARGALPIHEAVDFVLQACEAIAEAHAHGIIHRDLKPANLFLSTRADGSALVKVLDFGLSKATKLDAMDASLTAANAIMGSPFYMSPEQIRSLKGIDARADVWALGVILYQLLTGSRPFEAEAIGALFLAIASEEVPRPTARRPDMPLELEAAVLHCLEKDPRSRPQSVAELAREIAPFGSEDSRISVERIHRVLVDSTAFPRRSSISDGTDSGASLEAAARGARGLSSPPEAMAGSGPRSTPPPALKSGSMIAVASSVADAQESSASPPQPSTTRTPAPSRRGAVIGILGTVAILGAVGGAAFTLRAPSQAGGATTEASARGPATTAPVEPVVIASASATAPIVSAGIEAPPPIASAAPVASAAPSASAKAGASGKTGRLPAVVKKTKDPLDRWK